MLVVFLPAIGMAQHTCSISFSGKVFDAESKAILPFANVYVQELNRGSVADRSGSFSIDSICAGNYTVVCSFVGYQSITYSATVQTNVTYDFSLRTEVTSLHEIEVVGKKEEEQALVSQSKTDIKGEDLIKVRGATLGESLTSVPGVYTLQSGPSIFKPVIHGLHSNRILIFNNGVRQEGQQWGSEHAPEIDPFIATKLSVIKGASSIRYGSDAIAGVILVEPASFPDTPGVSGEFNSVAASNNRMGVVSGIVQASGEFQNAQLLYGEHRLRRG